MWTCRLTLPFEQASSCHSYMQMATDISSENPEPIIHNFKIQKKSNIIFLQDAIQVYKHPVAIFVHFTMFSC